jgi:hypothetical protein
MTLGSFFCAVAPLLLTQQELDMEKKIKSGTADETIKSRGLHEHPLNRRVFTDPEDEEPVYVKFGTKWLYGANRRHVNENGRLTWKLVTRAGAGEHWSAFRNPIVVTDVTRQLDLAGIAVGEDWERELEEKSIWDKYRVRKSDSEPVSWIVEGLIPAKAITVIAGLRGSFKTLFSLALAEAVCGGDDFLSRPTEMMKVFYVNRDNPKPLFADRLQALHLDGHVENFRHWSLWHEGGEPPKMDDDASEYFEIAKKCQPLMIFDSFQRFHSGDENSTKDVNAIFQIFRRLTTKGATVIVLHNSGRGATAIEDSADMLLGMQPIRARAKGFTVCLEVLRDKVRGGDGEKLLLKPSFPAEGETCDKFSFTVLKSETPVGKHKPEALTGRILEVLREDPEGLSGRSIVKKVGGKTQSVYQELNRLKREGVVSTKHGPKGATVYRLKAKVRSASLP